MVMLPIVGEAQTLESLVMPGPVIQGHAEFETDCKRCHRPFTKVGQSRLCRDCHKEVDADVQRKKGFHGRLPGIADGDCKTCHTEHEGRDADIVQLNRDTFDHHATDFRLEGAHAKLECGGCHDPKAKFRKAPSACIGCHRDDDRHKGRLGKACADCHTAKAWRDARFDHDAKTEFPLEGKHRDAICGACHVGERFENTPKDCVACHRLNDVHGGRFGTKCERCHNPAVWKRITFDHDKQTKFRLDGRHAKAQCAACHTGRMSARKLETTCIACHRNDDEHKGRNGPKCESCHGTSAWKRVAFDHGKNTKFPLDGSHARLDCVACHKGEVAKQKLGTGCYDCHKPDDVHAGQEGKRCQRCHNERGWRADVFFDHDLARFPLIGQHAVVACEECHLGPTFKGASLDCTACHAGDDSHKRGLGPDCATCHNPNGWSFWRFDHGKQTDFVLDGAHEGLACGACHRKPAKRQVDQSKACLGCHQSDDQHRGRFGQQCERCHVTKSFREIRIRR